MLLLLACSTPPSPPPAPAEPVAETLPLKAPVVEPPTIPALPAFTPTADALSDTISTIEPGGTPAVLVQRRTLTTGCAVSLLGLPQLDTQLLATLPFCPESLVVGGPHVLALTPGRSPAGWLIPLDGSPKLPLPDSAIGAQCVDAKGVPVDTKACPYTPAVLSSDAANVAATRVSDAAELSALNSAAASKSTAWLLAEGQPAVAWAELPEASGAVPSGPAMVKTEAGWALVASTSTIKPLRVNRAGHWLYIGSDRESQLFDLRTNRLVWRDPSRVWFWPPAAGPAPVLP